MQAYLLFHFNLAFSSINPSKYKKVIKNCYWPILFLADAGVKLAIEASSITLEIIQENDKNFIKKLKDLIKANKIQFIGSGYSQVIGPIFHNKLTDKNLEEGNLFYQKLLCIKPDTALVNEMALSESLIDLYKGNAYKNLVFDIDNVAVNLNSSKTSIYKNSFFKSKDDKKLINIIWSDSVMFQRFQRYIHGEISLERYLFYIKSCMKKYRYLPIYTNDAEVFNFRPGRFSQEKTIAENEWLKINNLIVSLQSLGIEFVFPKNLLSKTLAKPNGMKFPSNISHPVLVKKQPKYNLLRWTNTGRGDSEINLKINKIIHHINSNKQLDCSEIWRKVLFFASSDYRTHITTSKWRTYKKLLNDFTKLIKLNDSFKHPLASNALKTPFKKFGYEIITFSKYLLEIKSNDLCLKLNPAKGLSITSLQFKKHNFVDSIQSFQADYFDSINFGVDFFSSTLVFDNPIERSKQTDLKEVNPEISFDNGSITLTSKFRFNEFIFHKTYTLREACQEVEVGFYFNSVSKFIGIIRAGNFTFNTSTLFKNPSISSNLGGKIDESFVIDRDVDHASPVSYYVSANSCIPSANGITRIVNDDGVGLEFSIDYENSFAMPMIKYKKLRPSSFLRMYYSIREIDDTAKKSASLQPLLLKLRPI